MIKFYLSILLLYCILLSFLAGHVHAQPTIKIDGAVNEYIFKQKEILYLEDTTGKLTFNDITRPLKAKQFKPNPRYYPKNFNHKATYWFKIKVNFNGRFGDPQSVIEFFDQTTNYITAYMPDTKGRYEEIRTGSARNFEERLFRHKNFEFLIKNRTPGEQTYYFKVKSQEMVNVIIVYRTIDYFIQYALVEYLSYGLFYGMILIFCLHNLLMFAATRLRQYLYYVLYILSIGVYQMSTDGIAFQFLWPTASAWNEYAYGFALYGASVFALVFAKTLLQVKKRNKTLYKLINGVIIIRTIYFLFCFFVQKSFFIYRFVEIIPLSVAFYTGIAIWRGGFKPARFFVLAYAFLFIGFMVKGLYVLGFARAIPLPGAVGYYSMTFGFVCEMILLSFSIGDQVRLFRREKDRAQEETIRQMNINADLKDSINRELELQVRERTSEVVQKSEKIKHQAEIIEIQNQHLMEINKQLEHQAEEISRMNVLLEQDNIELKNNIERVTEARIESTELTFEEFSQKYPDREHCNKFLAELKWADGYACVKCGNTNYGPGRAPFSRRCSKCAYDESVIHNTIFENSRIPINKAFYIVYLMYSTKGNISSYQLSEKLNMRQGTCWAYAMRVKTIMDDRKARLRKNKKAGWSNLILKTG